MDDWLKKTYVPSERDYVKDFPSENGSYFNYCRECDMLFMGHKRRRICKKCFDKNIEEE